MQSQLITSKGYPFEQHFVETTDGYILGIHRIPPKQKGIILFFLKMFLLFARNMKMQKLKQCNSCM